MVWLGVLMMAVMEVGATADAAEPPLSPPCSGGWAMAAVDRGAISGR